MHRYILFQEYCQSSVGNIWVKFSKYITMQTVMNKFVPSRIVHHLFLVIIIWVIIFEMQKYL